MARLLLIASIVLGFVTAFLGFKTKQQAEELQEKLKSQTAAANQAKQLMTTAQKERDEAKKSFDEIQATLKQREAEFTDAKAAAEKAKADLTKALADVDAKTAKLEEVEKARKILEEKIGPVPPEQLAAKMEELTKEKTRLEGERDEAKAVAAAATERYNDLSATVAQKDQTIQEYKSNYVRQGLSGKIVAYNPGWNFVVLNIGDRSGLKAGVPMVVLRGGNMVGKVKVTSVETNTAIADVLPGTIARGDSVQPGDTVVFEGARR
jgi:hypothetical protein